MNISIICASMGTLALAGVSVLSLIKACGLRREAALDLELSEMNLDMLPKLNEEPVAYSYTKSPDRSCWDVSAIYLTGDGYEQRMLIRTFGYDDRDRDSEQYARRCAEELIEKLNEKI